MAQEQPSLRAQAAKGLREIGIALHFPKGVPPYGGDHQDRLSSALAGNVWRGQECAGGASAGGGLPAHSKR
ncbi:MAG TPA: hypothetical protein VL051_16615, partial [Burkholderiaceae bacterium]|nr:hypothetical protein [Burkholderiaceae bacterium]